MAQPNHVNGSSDPTTIHVTQPRILGKGQFEVSEDGKQAIRNITTEDGRRLRVFIKINCKNDDAKIAAYLDKFTETKINAATRLAVEMGLGKENPNLKAVLFKQNRDGNLTQVKQELKDKKILKLNSKYFKEKLAGTTNASEQKEWEKLQKSIEATKFIWNKNYKEKLKKDEVGLPETFEEDIYKQRGNQLTEEAAHPGRSAHRKSTADLPGDEHEKTSQPAPAQDIEQGRFEKLYGHIKSGLGTVKEKLTPTKYDLPGEESDEEKEIPLKTHRELQEENAMGDQGQLEEEDTLSQSTNEGISEEMENASPQTASIKPQQIQEEEKFGIAVNMTKDEIKDFEMLRNNVSAVNTLYKKQIAATLGVQVSDIPEELIETLDEYFYHEDVTFVGGDPKDPWANFRRYILEPIDKYNVEKGKSEPKRDKSLKSRVLGAFDRFFPSKPTLTFEFETEKNIGYLFPNTLDDLKALDTLKKELLLLKDEYDEKFNQIFPNDKIKDKVDEYFSKNRYGTFTELLEPHPQSQNTQTRNVQERTTDEDMNFDNYV